LDGEWKVKWISLVVRSSQPERMIKVEESMLYHSVPK